VIDTTAEANEAEAWRSLALQASVFVFGNTHALSQEARCFAASNSMPLARWLLSRHGLIIKANR
jgi:hypothetical protein